MSLAPLRTARQLLGVVGAGGSAMAIGGYDGRQASRAGEARCPPPHTLCLCLRLTAPFQRTFEVHHSTSAPAAPRGAAPLELPLFHFLAFYKAPGALARPENFSFLGLSFACPRARERALCLPFCAGPCAIT